MVDINKFTVPERPVLAISMEKVVQPTEVKSGLPRHRRGEKFLKGPVPWTWLCEAGRLRGSTLHVGLAIWHLAGLHGSSTVKLSNNLVAELGIDRHAKRRGLAVLEAAGLVSVERHAGRSPIITIRDTASNR